jgi:hypothetical protein
MKIQRRWRRLIALIVALPFIFEAILSLYWQFKPISPAFFAVSAEAPGYQLAAGVHERYWTFGRQVTVTIDKNGRRIVPGAASEGTVVHVVGDSQIFGWGLSDDETICSRLQSQLGSGFHVVNHGVPGLGPYGYIQLLRDVPVNELTVLVQTEENDLWDAYSANSRMTVRCGYLIPADFWGRNMPTLVLNSYLFQSFLDVKYAMWDSQRMTPIGFNPYAQAAAAVLKYRMDQLYAAQKEVRGDRLIITAIPWDGDILPQRMDEFSPRIEKPVRLVAFTDDCGMVNAFEHAANPDTLFQKHDAHLTAAGAALAARVIAPWVAQATKGSG